MLLTNIQKKITWQRSLVLQWNKPWAVFKMAFNNNISLPSKMKQGNVEFTKQCEAKLHNMKWQIYKVGLRVFKYCAWQGEFWQHSHAVCFDLIYCRVFLVKPCWKGNKHWLLFSTTQLTNYCAYETCLDVLAWQDMAWHTACKGSFFEHQILSPAEPQHNRVYKGKIWTYYWTLCSWAKSQITAKQTQQVQPYVAVVTYTCLQYIADST